MSICIVPAEYGNRFSQHLLNSHSAQILYLYVLSHLIIALAPLAHFNVCKVGLKYPAVILRVSQPSKTLLGSDINHLLKAGDKARPLWGKQDSLGCSG